MKMVIAPTHLVWALRHLLQMPEPRGHSPPAPGRDDARDASHAEGCLARSWDTHSVSPYTADRVFPAHPTTNRHPHYRSPCMDSIPSHFTIKSPSLSTPISRNCIFYKSVITRALSYYILSCK